MGIGGFHGAEDRFAPRRGRRPILDSPRRVTVPADSLPGNSPPSFPPTLFGTAGGATPDRVWRPREGSGPALRIRPASAGYQSSLKVQPLPDRRGDPVRADAGMGPIGKSWQIAGSRPPDAMTARRRGRTPPAYGPAGDAPARSAPSRPSTARADCACRLRRPSADDATEPVFRVLPRDDIAPAPQPIGRVDPKFPSLGPHGVVSAVGSGPPCLPQRLARDGPPGMSPRRGHALKRFRPYECRSGAQSPPSQPRTLPDSPSFCVLGGVCTGETA